MRLVELTEKDKDQYNNFVTSQDSGSFLQSWEWGQWQETQGHQVFRFFGINKDRPDDVWFAIQLLKYNISKNKFYLYVPYGPVTDFRFQISDFRFFMQELQAKFPGAIFVRIEPKSQSTIYNLQSTIKKTLHIQPINTLILDLEKTVDELLKEMHPKTRYNIKVAQKHGVEVSSELVVVPGHGLYWSEALNLITETAKRQKFKTFPPSYYQKLLDFFATKNSSSDLKVYVYRALAERELLATAVMVDFGQTRTYLFGGSSNKRREVMAPHLLHFKAITDAKNSGLKIYDFWGLETLSEKHPGFARFKIGFGGKKMEYAGAYDAVFNQSQYKLYQAMRYVNRLRFKLMK
jgi:peptidoglycan pentaglycine glycine transferase (the first glycine)